MKEVYFPTQKRGFIDSLGYFLSKIGGSMEIVFILLIWFFIFSDTKSLDNFTFQDIIAYLLIGNLIGMFTSYLLSKTIRYNIGQGDIKMFYYHPLQYVLRVFLRTFKKLTIPFFLSISLNLVLLYFFVDNVYFNYEIKYLVLIFCIISLAFVTELLLALIFDIYVFWTYESLGLARAISRLKKIFAGAYFPLSFLGAKFLLFSLFLPFAYSFYVPTQLYLKNISFSQGLSGILVQLFWIGIFFVIIRLSWTRKMETSKKIVGRKTVL